MGCKPKKLENGKECPYTKNGETCTVSCNGTFFLKGSNQLECKENKWVTGIEPYCDELRHVKIGNHQINISKGNVSNMIIVNGITNLKI